MNLRSCLPLAATLISLLGLTAQAQQPPATPSSNSNSNDRPMRVVKVKITAPSGYSNYRYRLGLGTPHSYFAGFRLMVLNSTDVGQPQKPGREELSGRIKYDRITLVRGVTRDSSFAQWVVHAQGHEEARDLVMDIFNESGQKSESYKLIGCVVTEGASVPSVDDAAKNVAIERVQLSCRGVQ